VKPRPWSVKLKRSAGNEWAAPIRRIGPRRSGASLYCCCFCDEADKGRLAVVSKSLVRGLANSRRGAVSGAWSGWRWAIITSVSRMHKTKPLGMSKVTPGRASIAMRMAFSGPFQRSRSQQQSYEAYRILELGRQDEIRTHIACLMTNLLTQRGMAPFR